MNSGTAFGLSLVTGLIALATTSVPTHAQTPMAMKTIDPAFVGTWSLVAADVRHKDGSVSHDYGPAPHGMLYIDAQGRYSLQIFNSERMPFASPDKNAATPDEYKSAVLGVSTHFGTVNADPTRMALTFHIRKASYPNWEGSEQVRTYAMKDGQLSYTVPARPNGDVPISVWRHLD